MNSVSKCTIAALVILTAATATSAQVEIGPPRDDVWCYIRSENPGHDPVLRAWGSEGLDLNPTGYPPEIGTEDFWSHGFLSWRITNLPPNYRWNGATITLTVTDGTVYNPSQSNIYLRLLTDGFDEDTWVYGVGAAPIPGDTKRLEGDDSRAGNGAGSTVTFNIPRNIPESILRQWTRNRRIDVAVTSDCDYFNTRQILRFASNDNGVYDPPTLTLR